MTDVSKGPGDGRLSSMADRPRPRRDFRRAVQIVRAGVVLLVAALTLLLAAAPWLDLPARPLPGTADAIVVLGGEHPSRILTAVELYQAGQAPAIWITGDVPPPGSEVSLAETARYVAFQHGVPMRRQQLLASRSTWEDGAAIADFVGQTGARRLIVITNWYHGRRALCVIERQLAGSQVEIGYTPAPSTRAPRSIWWLTPGGWTMVGRELAAFALYWQRYGIDPRSC